MKHKGYAEYPEEKKEPNVKRLLSLGHSVEWHSINNFKMLSKYSPDIKIKYLQQALPLFRLDPIPGDDTQQELVEGHLDLAVFYKGEGGFGDVKSTKDKFSQSYKTYWDETVDKFNNMKTLASVSETCWYADNLPAFLAELNDTFFEDNFHQLNAYCCSEFAKTHNITHGFIYRYCKNDSRHLEIRFRPSEALFAEFKKKANIVNKAVAQKKPELVKRDATLGSIRCAFCPYAQECWTGNAKQAFFDTLPKKKWPTRTQRLKNGMTIDASLMRLEELAGTDKERATLEQTIITALVDSNVNRIQLENGHIYEVKELKTKGFVLRRGKL